MSRQSVEWILTQQGGGNAAVIAVGGAEEALESRPGVHKLTLKHRKGFVKAAIRTGSVSLHHHGEKGELYKEEGDVGNDTKHPVRTNVQSFQECSGESCLSLVFGGLQVSSRLEKQKHVHVAMVMMKLFLIGDCCFSHRSASLVPAYSFGETDLYFQADNPQGSTLRCLQDRVKRLVGVSPALFYGRGIFNYSFGFLPHRRPINTVCTCNRRNPCRTTF